MERVGRVEGDVGEVLITTGIRRDTRFDRKFHQTHECAAPARRPPPPPAPPPPLPPTSDAA